MVGNVVLDTRYARSTKVSIIYRLAIKLSIGIDLLVGYLDLVLLGIYQPLVSIFELDWRFNIVVAAGKIGIHVPVDVGPEIIQRGINVFVVFVGRIDRITQLNHLLVVVPQGQNADYTDSDK